jgi:mRNA interferase RelE/StbE
VYRAEIRSGVAEVIRALPPQVKRAVKAAIRAIGEDPLAGEPLHGELEGRFKYRVRRYRVIYLVNRKSKVVDIIGVGHRRSVYEELAEQLRQEK